MLKAASLYLSHKTKERIMAAFESTGVLTLKPIRSSTDLVVDLRIAKLPFKRPAAAEDDFDPRNHRHPRVVIKPWMAYLNLMRAAVGIGMLGAPLAISHAGLLFGPFYFLSIGCLLIHTHLTLLSCLNEVCRQLRVPYVSYRYGARLALLHGPPLLHGLGKWAPNPSHCSLPDPTVRIIFVADNLSDMMDWSDSTKSLGIMILPTLFLEILMKNLRIISYIVNGGNVINLLGLILVIVQIFRGPRRETHLFPSGWASMLLATGTCLFNLSAVGVILSCEKSLEDPHLMSRSPFGVVRVGLMVPTLVNILMGALGYWSYGRADENILRYLAYDDLVTMAALGLFSVSAIMGYPVFCYPGVQIILEVIMNHDRNLPSPITNLTKDLS
ncbi:transmembrane amino acid transporter protein domain-containing protein [Phthorimaea operculella]|nr:transmembrane amino acid transporter protein domain-containing protein [Phthorimaea operculella]